MVDSRDESGHYFWRLPFLGDIFVIFGRDRRELLFASPPCVNNGNASVDQVNKQR